MKALKSLILVQTLAACGWALAAPTLIQNVRVFDGERMHKGRSVLFDGAQIVDSNFRGRAPAGAVLVDGTGKTLLPGLIDAHVHAYRYLDLPLMFGVTTQIDMFNSVATMQDVAHKMKTGANSGQADLFSAGTLVTAPGGHGSQYGIPIPTLTKPADAQAFIDARIAEGSHFIKIVMEEGGQTGALNSLDEATVRAAVAAAHARGKLAVVHVSSLKNARAALEAGADGLVHLFYNGTHTADEIAAFASLAKQRKAFVIPTFAVIHSMAGIRPEELLGDAGFMALLDKDQRATLKATYAARPFQVRLATPQATARALRIAGVPLLAGTDAGNTGTQYGASLHHEMAALVQTGMSPLQALSAATMLPAKAFRLGQRGRIAKGYKADLLLVDGDPGSDIASTRRIVAVWKDGVDVAPLRERQRALVAKEASGAPDAPLALPADGRISLFSKEKLASPFGVGWVPASDSVMAGKSTVQLVYLDADGALEVQANVASGFAYPFAGVSFMPGKMMMQPANLSAAKRISFRVRGDGQQYSVAIMSQGSKIPVGLPFTAGKDWQEVNLPLSEFKGIDPGGISMIAFNAGPQLGAYRFQIAEVRLLQD